MAIYNETIDLEFWSDLLWILVEHSDAACSADDMLCVGPPDKEVQTEKEREFIAK